MGDTDHVFHRRSREAVAVLTAEQVAHYHHRGYVFPDYRLRC